MSIVVKKDWREVHMQLSGTMSGEHIAMIQARVLEQLQYGYRRFVLDVRQLAELAEGSDWLLRLQYLVAVQGGQLTVESTAA